LREAAATDEAQLLADGRPDDDQPGDSVTAG
jgi:hypothetical protein